ncbi:hypothetical protein CMQ_344 [Grosmannia clavigera kw1407]|uniref:Uncharacterized protein n=1 Tax=Grosmannia clavigera (strain kw1407 / UAMH 11150) TaxID=655863 RepID=F0XR67_GROCL|nr:uncharacterized protein CMQ_344 [Grosmannia clavigera kw1407]EFX00027.1 hypothetical protein CMQ_344 [Grosmannia clavigera kw1407]
MQGYDDLAALLARNLTLNPIPVAVPAPVEEQTPLPPKISYSISQHYTHSAHMLQRQYQQQEELVDPEQQAAEALLRQHGIDPSRLTAVQLALFRMSTPDRRDYIMQLWRICPPTTDGMADNEVMSLDGTAVPVASQQHFTTQQDGSGRWVQSTSHSYTEPYMMSGYEELARREYQTSASDDSCIPRSAGVALRTDPVYNNRLDMSGRASWPPQSHLACTDMENQYGKLMAMRDSGAMEM